jgi:deoxyribonuclease-4
MPSGFPPESHPSERLKNPLGSHKDRHENIGYGTLGFPFFPYRLGKKDFLGIPKILETPTDGIHDPYAKEIAMLTSESIRKGLARSLITC